MCLVFVARIDYENILTTKISRFTVVCDFDYIFSAYQMSDSVRILSPRSTSGAVHSGVPRRCLVLSSSRVSCIMCNILQHGSMKSPLFLSIYQADLCSTSKISQFDIAWNVTQDVTAFEVTVYDSTSVKVLYTFQDLSRVVQRQRLWEWSSFFKTRGQRALHKHSKCTKFVP